MSEEDRNNFKTYMVKEKDFTDLIIKDKEDNYYYSAIYVNELQQEIERLNKRIEDLNIINEEHKILNGMIRKELQQKENIIKEVREYIEEHIRIDDEYPDYMEMLLEEYKELLEILDKGSNKE